MSSKLQNIINLALKTFSFSTINTNKGVHFCSSIQSTNNYTKLCNLLNTITLNDIDFNVIDDSHELVNDFNSKMHTPFTSNNPFESYLNEKETITKRQNLIERIRFKNTLCYIESDAPCLHMEIFESQYLSLSVFLIRKGYSIPLHNHPNMHGIIKILHGDGDITAYTQIPANNTKGTSVDDSKQIKVVHDFTKRLSVYGSDSTEKPDATDLSLITLSPNINNIHEINASLQSDLVFIDVISPAYESNCDYYEIVNENENVDNEQNEKENVNNQENNENNNANVINKEICLKQILSPPSYFCDSLIYTGPTLNA